MGAYGNDYGVQSINKLSDVSQTFLAELKSWLEQIGLSIPVNQIQGFSGFQAQTANIDTSESTASAGYTDLATVGPQFTGANSLRPGKYMLFFGARVIIGVGGSFISPSVNGVAASDNDAIIQESNSMAFRALGPITLPSDTNTVTLKYRTAGGTATFERRYLSALKVA